MAQPLELHRITKVQFHRFKALKSFRLDLRAFNVMVGPNNAGKSTILTAFRILAAALRRANSKAAEPVSGPHGKVLGHSIDIRTISVAEENIFYNYDATSPAHITFHLNNGNALTLYFPDPGACLLLYDSQGKKANTPTAFRTQFNCPIGFVPILGPVDHHEALYDKEAARLALFNYRAARNFRNIWHHYPEDFEDFRSLIKETWPGMDISLPEINTSTPGKPQLNMFCPEVRIPREIFWAGFGFQVWCQMLTHLIKSKDKSLFLIDEPDIYLHSDLQRQLLTILRALGPDILIATHSTEIVSEAEPDDIILVSKSRQSAKRLREPAQLSQAFGILGSNANPVLTQLAKTRRAVFVEGDDFQLISKFARKLGYLDLSNRRGFAVVPVGGHSPERVRSLKLGMETALGQEITCFALLDRDYRCAAERAALLQQCSKFCADTIVLECKEIENFLLVPSAIDRAIGIKLSGETGGAPSAFELLANFAEDRKGYVCSRILTERWKYLRKATPGVQEAAVAEQGLNEFESQWKNEKRIQLCPGKEALSHINDQIQKCHGISVTPFSVIDAMHISEVPTEIVDLMKRLDAFANGH